GYEGRLHALRLLPAVHLLGPLRHHDGNAGTVQLHVRGRDPQRLRVVHLPPVPRHDERSRFLGVLPYRLGRGPALDVRLSGFGGNVVRHQPRVPEHQLRHHRLRRGRGQLHAGRRLSMASANSFRVRIPRPTGEGETGSPLGGPGSERTADDLPGTFITAMPALAEPAMKELQVRPVNPPYSYSRVTYNDRTKEYLYEVIEPQLSRHETELVAHLKETLTKIIGG